MNEHIPVSVGVGVGIGIGIDHHRVLQLCRMAAMLIRLGGRGYQVREDQAAYSVDFDPDSDFDPEERKSQYLSSCYGSIIPGILSLSCRDVSIRGSPSWHDHATSDCIARQPLLW